MAIHTQESLSGFIASDPQLTETAKGDARLFARIGKEHFRREEDGSFTQTETTYHHLVMFGRSAEHAHANFVAGDSFIAEGYTREVSYERNGQAIESEEFVAKKIGHDAARTRYTVDRSPRNGVARDAAAYDSPQRSTPKAHTTLVSM
ncbi:single-stranded DNA-binding protein [Micropruina sp.]|uniref:single-stranded DNA-binding protein n=1 Tax=Micropruina sp. TaxID=2737536 RepID=UPI0039E2696D